MNRLFSKAKDAASILSGRRETIPQDIASNYTKRRTATVLGEDLYRREYYEDMLGRRVD